MCLHPCVPSCHRAWPGCMLAVLVIACDRLRDISSVLITMYV